MSHIVGFHIENLAGRSSPLSCNMDRTLNVFFGLNGSGKTSLLKILHSAMSGDARTLVNVPFSSAEIRIHSVSYNKVFTRRIQRPADPTSPAMHLVWAATPSTLESDTRLIQTQPTAMPNWTQEPRIPHKEGLTSWSHRYLPTTRLQEGAFFSYQANPASVTGTLTEEQFDQIYATLLTSLWSNYNTQLLSRLGKAQEEGLAHILEEVLTSVPEDTAVSTGDAPPREAYESLKAFLARQDSRVDIGTFEDFEQRFQRERTFHQVVVDIHKVELQSKAIIKPRNSIQKLVGELFSGGKMVKFDDTAIRVYDSMEHEISLPSLSSGEKHLMRILVEALLAEENSLIIDEPELSLHIDWQRQLLKNMMQLNGDAQLIVATHSPEVMADVDEDNIIRL